MSPLIFGALALSHLLNSLKINGAFSVLLTIFIYYYGGGLLELLKFINKNGLFYTIILLHFLKNISRIR